MSWEHKNSGPGGIGLGGATERSALWWQEVIIRARMIVNAFKDDNFIFNGINYIDISVVNEHLKRIIPCCGAEKK